MAKDQTTIDLSSATQSDIIQMIEIGADGIVAVDATSADSLQLPAGSSLDFPAILGNDLILLQPDGTILVLRDALNATATLEGDLGPIALARVLDAATPQQNWTSLSDLRPVSLDSLFSESMSVPGSAARPEWTNVDRLTGLPINPLLPPTAYIFPPDRDRPYCGAYEGSAPPDETNGAVSLTRPILIRETDDLTQITLAITSSYLRRTQP